MMTLTQRQNCRLQFISHTTPTLTVTDGIRLALAGGCRWIQLRMKEADDALLLATAMEVKQMCRQAGATFIIDDRADMVLLTGADGVHLGQNDMPVDEARRLLGPHAIIGGTANTLADVARHHQRGADYIGCGPFRFTTTKQRLAPVLGTDGYRHIIDGMRQQDITLPMVAIGGITANDIPAIMQTGVQGIALSGSILRADSPVQEMQHVADIISQSTHNII